LGTLTLILSLKKGEGRVRVKGFQGKNSPDVCSSIGISIIPIPWIQTDKGRLKTE